MTPDSWRPIEELYVAVCDLPTAEQNKLLARANPELRAEVEAILATHGSALEHPAWEGRAILSATDTSVLERDDTAITVLAAGTLIGRYQIQAPLGKGGMGQVFRACDTRLGRTVALKLVRSEFTRRKDFRSRLEREAQAVSALNHPNICALYDIGEHDGVPFLVMEYVEGETLTDLLKKGRPAVDDTLRYGIQIASALAAAHASNIIHRDLKPSNVMISAAGVKVLDFGIAKNLTSNSDRKFVLTGTEPGQIIGTPAYMSPEQISGDTVDSRSDIFALGALLYEMLCGRRPFHGDTAISTVWAMLHKSPDPPRSLQPDIPAPLERIVMRCLEKKPGARFASADEVYRALSAQLPSSARGMRKPRAAAIAAALLVLLGTAFAIRQQIRESRIRWAQKEAIPRIARLIGENRRLEALKLYQQVLEYAPASSALPALAEGVSGQPVSFRSTPPGAKLFISDYTAAAGDNLADWRPLGSAPLSAGGIPRWGYYRIRAEKEGFAPLIQTFFPVAGLHMELTMQPAAAVPPGMVWVPAGDAISLAPPLRLPGFWMDAYEVSNREFKKFVDAGGYQKPEYWKQPFFRQGKPLSWQQAIEQFRDSTRRPGPASWQFGTYPDGTAAMPVGGVSWYEAAAYAEFAGKSLPTFYEWYRASGYHDPNSEILVASNFAGKGPAETGTRRGMAPFGTYDMAGNLSEWTASAVGASRYILGGAWDQEPYQFGAAVQKDPMARLATSGFRSIRRATPPPPESLRPVTLFADDPERGKPVDDATYRIFARLQAYDKTRLDAKVEEVDDSSPYWRRETITFPAAYGGERMMLHLFLPKNSAPPYQVVVVFGGINIFYTKRVQDFQMPYEFLLRAGRAAVIPVFSGTLERGPSPVELPVNQKRERALRWPMDMGQTIDYLETRPDIDVKKLGFYGVSFGPAQGVRLMALDGRLKAAAFVSGGLPRNQPPEIDAWNYAPRVRTPVLMLNGRDDLATPVRTAQMPLFNALGTPASDKRYVQYEGGHANLVSRPELIGQMLEWFDHYLGPVKRRP